MRTTSFLSFSFLVVFLFSFFNPLLMGQLIGQLNPLKVAHARADFTHPAQNLNQTQRPDLFQNVAPANQRQVAQNVTQTQEPQPPRNIKTSNDKPVTVGGKNFTENYLLAEFVSQTIERQIRVPVRREFGLQGSGIIYGALRQGEIDVYVEYTGTISEVLLKRKDLNSKDEIRRELKKQNLIMSDSIGFNNAYAIAVRRPFADKFKLKTMSDLKRISYAARFAFSYEFMARSDGFPAMNSFYNLQIPLKNTRSMEHALIYSAIEAALVDVIEVYSTDAKMNDLDLVILQDDKKFFPSYEAVMLTREDFVKNHPEIWNLLVSDIRISEEDMRLLNAEVDIQKKSFSAVISHYLKKVDVYTDNDSLFSRVWRRTQEHFFLVVISVLASFLCGLPLAVMAFYKPWLAQTILLFSSVVQTIPSLALLCFLIPIFGIGKNPALFALFLYGLLPIVLNTYTGLKNLDKSYREISVALGLTFWQRLNIVELPLISPQILAGIKSSAIISIGTATLAALIGAGGYGAPIVSGLATNDIPTILQGAVPAALMALCVHILFEILQKFVIPKGLR